MRMPEHAAAVGPDGRRLPISLSRAGGVEPQGCKPLEWIRCAAAIAACGGTTGPGLVACLAVAAPGCIKCDDLDRQAYSAEQMSAMSMARRTEMRLPESLPTKPSQADQPVYAFAAFDGDYAPAVPRLPRSQENQVRHRLRKEGRIWRMCRPLPHRRPGLRRRVGQLQQRLIERATLPTGQAGFGEAHGPHPQRPVTQRSGAAIS